jgi:hypothetical protein
MKRLTRRAFLRGLGATTAAAGAVPLLGPSLVRGDTCPTAAPGAVKRFIAVMTPIGFVRDQWARSTGSRGREFELIGSLTPLEPFQDRLLLLKGLDMGASYGGDAGTGHPRGIGALLTGRRLNPGSFGEGVGWASGQSIDQRIADHFGDATPFRSLELGVGLGNRNSVFNRVSYAGSDRPLASVDDPRVVFDRLFGGLAGDASRQMQRRAERRSVLDFVGEELAALRAAAGAEARADLDAHLEAMRGLERRVDEVASCEAPTAPLAFDPQDPIQYPAIGRTQMDLLVEAMRCDHTRVATLLWSGAVSSQTFRFLARPITEGHHPLSHPGANGYPLADALDKQTRIYHWYAAQLAYLLERLACTPDPTAPGSLLDHTVVFWGTELAHAETHERRNMRFVLAGGDSFFRTGRLLTVDRSHNDLLVSLARACGVPITTFGEAAHCAGPITEIHR